MNLKLMGRMLRTEVVIVAANGLLIAVEGALEFQKRIVQRTTYQEDPPTREVQVTPIFPVKVAGLICKSAKMTLTKSLGLLALSVLLQHWRLWPEELHEPPPPEVGAATAARAQAEVTMRASLENIARVKSE
jgi:hypothetical protein